ncbi:MAG TPA: hypothetical protein VGO71_03205 [Baekduia sp.]|jgi:hypothetical protein|nr:hypothetical protein [Baekduia sp.]
MSMDPLVARDVACRLHGGQRTRFGELVIDHLDRVQAAVPADARATAWLHDALEGPGMTQRELRLCRLGAVEREALELLTHAPTEPYELYVGRIARAPGAAGRLARAIKAADLDDHLAHTAIPADAPPYAWARRRIAAARALRQDVEQATGAGSIPVMPRSRRRRHLRRWSPSRSSC